MRVPVQVLIGGKKVRIKYVRELLDDDGTGLCGDTCVEDLQIRISKSRHKNERQLFATLYHELLHMALGIAGISAVWKDEQEEPIVYALESMLADLLGFNPAAKIRWREVTWPGIEEDEG